jgi:hypothetical protein
MRGRVKLQRPTEVSQHQGKGGAWKMSSIKKQQLLLLMAACVTRGNCVHRPAAAPAD